MDLGCLICLGDHHTKDCGDRSPENCFDCHAFIRPKSDHTEVCSTKLWLYKPHKGVYAKSLKTRCIISISTPFRYLKDTCWCKPTDGVEMYSSVNGAFIRFVSNHDICLNTTKFEEIQIRVVVKEKTNTEDRFFEKRLLYTSKNKLIVAADANKEFDRSAAINRNTSLILAVSGENEPRITISVFPLNKPTRNFVVRFDTDTKMFDIPEGLLIGGSTNEPSGGHQDDIVYAQVENQPDKDNECLQLEHFFENPLRERNPVTATNVQVHRIKERYYQHCFECHVPINPSNQLRAY